VTDDDDNDNNDDYSVWCVCVLSP